MNVEYPDMPGIWAHCKPIIAENATKKGKGNSWRDMQAADGFWADKLKEEVAELKKAQTPEELLKEVCDIINVSAFVAQNIIDGRVAMTYSVGCSVCHAVIQAKTRKKLDQLVDEHEKQTGHDDFHTCVYDEASHKFVGI